ncbi:MAG: hypothetical protein KDD44_10070, partial [Bdellovibrionales bacterium]|nr:hypothetical protein [Bdellovibrionales bacterium]
MPVYSASVLHLGATPRAVLSPARFGHVEGRPQDLGVRDTRIGWEFADRYMRSGKLSPPQPIVVLAQTLPGAASHSRLIETNFGRLVALQEVFGGSEWTANQRVFVPFPARKESPGDAAWRVPVRAWVLQGGFFFRELKY